MRDSLGCDMIGLYRVAERNTVTGTCKGLASILLELRIGSLRKSPHDALASSGGFSVGPTPRSGGAAWTRINQKRKQLSKDFEIVRIMLTAKPHTVYVIINIICLETRTDRGPLSPTLCHTRRRASFMPARNLFEGLCG